MNRSPKFTLTRRTIIVCSTLLAMTGAITAVAHLLNSSMSVSTTVLAVQKIRSMDFPQSLTITDADALQGSVATDSTGQFSVYANNRGGYRLQISIRSPQITGVDITGLDGGPVSIAYPSTVVYQPWLQGSLRDYAVNFRFHLAPGTPPGSLEWPVDINVLPL